MSKGINKYLNEQRNMFGDSPGLERQFNNKMSYYEREMERLQKSLLDYVEDFVGSTDVPGRSFDTIFEYIEDKWPKLADILYNTGKY